MLHSIVTTRQNTNIFSGHLTMLDRARATAIARGHSVSWSSIGLSVCLCLDGSRYRNTFCTVRQSDLYI